MPVLRHLEALAPAVDVLHAGKAEVGTHVPTAIKAMIQSADVCVLLLSSDYAVESDAELKFALDERERRSNGLRLVPLLVRNYRLEGTRMEGLALVSPIPLAAHQHADDVCMRLAEEVARILGTTLSARPDASGDAAPTSEPRVMLPFPAALPNIPSLAPVSPLAALFPAEALSETPPPVTAAVEEVQPSGEPARIAISTPLPLPGASTAVADAREPSDVTSPSGPEDALPLADQVLAAGADGQPLSGLTTGAPAVDPGPSHHGQPPTAGYPSFTGHATDGYPQWQGQAYSVPGVESQSPGSQYAIVSRVAPPPRSPLPWLVVVAVLGAGGVAAVAGVAWNALRHDPTAPTAIPSTTASVDASSLPTANGPRVSKPPCPPDMAYVKEEGAFPAICMDRNEVTLGKYRECDSAACTIPKLANACNYVGSPSANDNLPVSCVTLANARAYCLSRDKHLPTAHEWMFAAAGASTEQKGAFGQGKMTTKRKYPWGNDVPRNNRGEVSFVSKACVGLQSLCAPGLHSGGDTEEGLHDMAGNAAELVDEPGTKPTTCGGAVDSKPAEHWLLAKCVGSVLSQNETTWTVGFRCARTPDK